MKINKIFILGIAALLIACSADDALHEQLEPDILSFSTSIDNFEGESVITRTNFLGNAFEDGDKIKLKIICPFSSHT